MNRQFQGKIHIGSYVLLLVLLAAGVSLVWQTSVMSRQMVGLLFAVDLVMMIIIVERMVHTTYSVIKHDDTWLLNIHKGKLSKDITIDLRDIDRIDRINKLRLGGKPLQTFLVIVLKNNKEYYITPKNEEEFIKCIAKRRS